MDACSGPPADQWIDSKDRRFGIHLTSIWYRGTISIAVIKAYYYCYNDLCFILL